MLAALAPVSRQARTYPATSTVASPSSAAVGVRSPVHRLTSPTSSAGGLRTPTSTASAARAGLPRTPHARSGNGTQSNVRVEEGKDVPHSGIAVPGAPAPGAQDTSATRILSISSAHDMSIDLNPSASATTVKLPLKYPDDAESTVPGPRTTTSESAATPPATPRAAAEEGADDWEPKTSALPDIYQELLDEKTTIKAHLRGYDRAFFAVWGRRPRKQDKEGLRPLYTIYNEVCAAVSRARKLTYFTDSVCCVSVPACRSSGS